MPQGMSQWAWAIVVGRSQLVSRDMGLLALRVLVGGPGDLAAGVGTGGFGRSAKCRRAPGACQTWWGLGDREVRKRAPLQPSGRSCRGAGCRLPLERTVGRSCEPGHGSARWRPATRRHRGTWRARKLASRAQGRGGESGRPHVPSLVVQPRVGPLGPGGRERSTARRALRQQPPVWVIGAKSAPEGRGGIFAVPTAVIAAPARPAARPLPIDWPWAARSADWGPVRAVTRSCA